MPRVMIPQAIGFYGSVSPSDALQLYAEGTIADESEHSNALLGASYTTLQGSVLTVEYFQRSEGCMEEAITACAEDTAGEAPGARTISDELVREQYFLAQYFRDFSQYDTSMVLRWIRGLDDSSNRVVLVIDHELSNRVELFGVANVLSGDTDSEFGSLLDYSAQIGINLTF